VRIGLYISVRSRIFESVCVCVDGLVPKDLVDWTQSRTYTYLSTSQLAHMIPSEIYYLKLEEAERLHVRPALSN
jgi:hypothetical protein